MFLHNDVKQSLLTKIPFLIVCFLGGRILTKRIAFKASRYIQPPFTGSTLPNKGDKLPVFGKHFSLIRNANSGGGG